MRHILSIAFIFLAASLGAQVKIQKTITPKKDTINAFYVTNTDFEKFRNKLNTAWGEAYINQDGLMRWSDVKLADISEKATIELHDGLMLAPGAYQVFQLGNEKEKMLKEIKPGQFRQIEIFIRNADNSYMKINSQQAEKFKVLLEKNL